MSGVRHRFCLGLIALSLVLSLLNAYLWYRGHFRRSGIEAHFNAVSQGVRSRVSDRTLQAIVAGGGIRLAFFSQTYFSGSKPVNGMRLGWCFFSANLYPNAAMTVSPQFEQIWTWRGFSACRGDETLKEAGCSYPLPNGRTAAPTISRCTSCAIVFPAELAAAIFAIAPLSLSGSIVMRRRAARRLAGGLCFACGYDLRASLGRCPECGRAFQQVVQADRGDASDVPSGGFGHLCG